MSNSKEILAVLRERDCLFAKRDVMVLDAKAYRAFKKRLGGFYFWREDVEQARCLGFRVVGDETHYVVPIEETETK